MKKTVATIITEKILNRMSEIERKIENGDADATAFRWVKPFAHGAPDRAYSYETLKAYRGINRLLLDNNEYLTYRMMQDLNKNIDSPQYQIRKGAKSDIVCFYTTKTLQDDETNESLIDEKTGEEIQKKILRYYNVFSREDIIRRDTGESLPSKFAFEHYSHDEITEQVRVALDRFNRLFNYYCKKYGIELEIIKDGTQAYFSHDMKIRVPEMSNFSSVYLWVATLAHEMGHSTGMFLGRFNDEESKDIERAMQDYSREELIAEICAQIIASEMQIPDDSELPDNAVAYIHSWSAFLKDRPGEILVAAAKAEKAAELIMECLREMELEKKESQKEETEKEGDR